MRKYYSYAVENSHAFDGLNQRQREAARFGGSDAAGPLLIIAGAGTGKTNTLAHRVAHLVLEGASADRILLLTFTRRAAIEMVRRTQRIVGDVKKDVRFPWSGTFHSVANRLLRRYAGALGLDASFSVLDRGDAADLIDVVRHGLGFSHAKKRFPRKDTCLAIYSHRVNTQRPLVETLEALFPWCAEWEKELIELYRAYVEKKLANQALDYDDLLLYWHVMMSDARLAAEIGAQFDHILVDEYQDTNVLQADILKRLRPNGSGVTVVGDDAQAIYSFRAATVENILGFPKQFSGENGSAATIVTLEENYRSTQGVLNAANALIGEGERQYKKVLQAHRGAGDQPRYVTVLGETDTRQGWRPGKATGGCVLDAANGAVVARGFAMPHSPRVHAGRLWLLDSGAGRLVTVDVGTGKAEPVAPLPGYGRGLAFLGSYAFVGLSRARER